MSTKQLGGASLFFLACLSSSALAEDMPSFFQPTSNMYGELGLNTIPSARMAPEGTTRFTVGRFKDYTHAALGFQLTDRLYLGLRQTAESKSFNSDTLHLYPGLDAKWMLYSEKRFVPQIAVGVQSAFGHKRMAAEYLSLSKHYENFDFTFGFGWGRMATRHTLPNPILLNNLNRHRDRDIDGENPNSPADWFKGDMALFGGVEYATPINGLALKADWNSDAWKAEKSADASFNAPAPWSVGLSYQPLSWMDAGLAYAGNHSVMARVSFTGNIGNWPWSEASNVGEVAMQSHRPDVNWSFLFGNDDDNQNNEDDTDDDSDDDHSNGIGNSSDREFSSEDRMRLSQILIHGKTIDADLILKDFIPAPKQIGNAARYLANIAGPEPEMITLHLRGYGLQGTNITMSRQDFERAYLQHQGSAEEIWYNTSFSDDQRDIPFSIKMSQIFGDKPRNHFKVSLLNDVSLSEEDSGLLYRTALGLSYTEYFKRHFISFQSLRLNLRDNLEKLNEYRGISLLPVRGDVDVFTQNRLMVDRSYFMGLATPFHDIHIASAFGYLEEMYAGLSGELLFRPFGKNWAVGIESALAFKRDPYTFSALAPNGDHILTGFLNGYYEIPNTGTTIKASVGRFLAGDIGGTLAATNQFKNGVKLSADISLSNYSDKDVYGGDTNVYTGIHVSLPLGSPWFLPDGTDIVTNAAPLGRDTAQRLDNPTNLYERTEPLSYRHITRQWYRISH